MQLKDDMLTSEVLIALRRIIQAIDLYSRSLVKKHGITLPQLVILQELSKNNEMPVGELAKAVSLGQATVTGILDRLENRGLIVRRKGDDDKRKVLTAATEECIKLIATTPSPLQQTFVSQFEKLQDWEKTMILVVLQRIVAMMDAKSIEAYPILTTDSLENLNEQVD
jgi:DNA-binding MarR family transcriptional regulator